MHGWHDLIQVPLMYEWTQEYIIPTHGAIYKWFHLWHLAVPIPTPYTYKNANVLLLETTLTLSS